MKEPKETPQGGKKPPTSVPAGADKSTVAGTGRLPSPKKQNASPPAVRTEATEVDGKQIRKDPPVAGSTNTVAQETIAIQPPETGEGPMSAVNKPAPAAKTPAGAEKTATALGDYKLLKKLGQGGMGTVYKAQQLSLDRVVALKVLDKGLASKGNFVERFLREARAMAKLDHPNVLRCFEVGQAKGFHFLAMELVEGGSVEGWLKKLGKLSVRDAMHIVIKTAEALQHAHEKNLIHRDIKPDNILFTKDGIVKVADLGLAKDSEEDVSLTKTGSGAGTPIYMAPEQARDVKHVDARVDIYALGVMMYVLLTGKTPFEGNTLVELITAKERGKFEPMRKHNGDIPAKLDLIVDKMMAKDPKHRYGSCKEVLIHLRPLGLAGPHLSFFEAPDTDVAIPNTQLNEKKASGQDTDSHVPVKAAAKTSIPGKPVGAMTSIEEEEVAERDVWYWNLVTPQGKVVTKKVTTEQVRALIKGGHVDHQGQISKTMKSGFRGAATFPEFQGAFKARETATRANAKGQKYRDKFKELEAAYDQKKRWSWMGRMFSGIGGTLFGLFWIMLILAVVGVAGYMGYMYFTNQ